MKHTYRLPAEWEPQSFVQFTFPHPESDWAYLYKKVVTCFVNIIETTAQYVPVLVGCNNVSVVKNHFQNPTKFPIHFVTVKSNDTWARDHAAITVLKNEKPILLDFVFNGWGQKFNAELDNLITVQLAKTVFKKQNIQSVNFVLEGGAIESDGKGTLLTTSECMLSSFRNPDLSKQQIETYLKQIFGLQKVLWLDHGYLAGDDTDSHIDTLVRFCNSNTIAYVKCNKEQDEHFEALQKMEAQLKTFTNTNNEYYNLVALPWPAVCLDTEGHRIPATYANFLITNNAVLVPTYNVPQDKIAIHSIQTIFPDRKVVGVDCRTLIEQHGSLHCITMQYPKQVELLN